MISRFWRTEVVEGLVSGVECGRNEKMRCCSEIEGGPLARKNITLALPLFTDSRL
jgi:hypothetical protein